MTQAALARAYLQGVHPPKKTGKHKAQPRDIPGARLDFDFNPETLTVEVSNSLEDKGKAFKKRQFVTGVVSKLSFEAVFDHTRPGPNVPATSGSNPQELDIRRRTQTLVELLDAQEIKIKPRKGSKRKRPRTKKPAPALVRFQWGSFIFQGVLEQYSETLEYFTPEGVPLRARVSVTLTQQKYLYDPGKDTPSTSPASNPSHAHPPLLREDLPWLDALDRAQGFEAAMGLGFDAGWSLTGSLDPGGLGTTMAFDVQGARGPFDLEVGGVLAEALGGPLADAALSLEVMGEWVLQETLGGVADVSQTTLGATARSERPDGRATSWSPEGLSPDSRAARVAEIALQRARTLRIRGMPPRTRPRFEEGDEP